MLPVYVANFVLMDYGTGAIFGCPAHDQRDLEFARKYGLGRSCPWCCRRAPIPPTFAIGDEAYVGDGRLFHSAFLDGLDVEAAKRRGHRGARGSRPAAAARPPGGCATGASRGSATGAARSR